MWILNQNKKVMLNTNNAISIEYTYDVICKKEYAVTYCNGSKEADNFVIMGIYPSKERCLEVIQDIIKNIHLKNPTYEMPEK